MVRPLLVYTSLRLHVSRLFPRLYSFFDKGSITTSKKVKRGPHKNKGVFFPFLIESEINFKIIVLKVTQKIICVVVIHLRQSLTLS